jgi:hypothetical protein
MSDLVSSVRAAIEKYAATKKESHNKIDVMRMLRDQSALLYEKQLVLDALTQDPMRQLHEYPNQIQRIQKLLQVNSCHRLVTQEGYSSIEAVVQLKKDDKMAKEVEQHLQLTFKYERRPMRPEDVVHESIPTSGTHINYTIEFSKDFGERHRLLVAECWAPGEAPSMEPAVPVDGWEDMDEEDEDGMEATVEEEEGNEKPMDATKEADSENEKDERDRFAAYMDPDVITQLLDWSGIEMDEGPLFFLLMTFPFWEQEWDLVGFVLDVIFGGEEDDDEIVEFDDEGEEINH